MNKRIRGLDSLIKKLHALDGNVKEVLTKTIEDNTVFVRDDARLRAPVDTGDLRQSIQCDVKEKDGKIIGTVYTNMEYAIYNELGTGPVGKATNENTSVNATYRPDGWTFYSDKLDRFVYTEGIPARPYMYPALHDNRQKIRNKIVKDVKVEIRRLESNG